MDAITIDVCNVPKIREWLINRGGIAVWYSLNFSAPKSVFTPADASKPAYDFPASPSFIVTDASQIIVQTSREVKRFHVAVRVSGSGLYVKCTDASSERIRREVQKAGEGAYHEFDYATQEAVIFAADKRIPLSEYKEEV